jgi:hypothetical protein
MFHPHSLLDRETYCYNVYQVAEVVDYTHLRVVAPGGVDDGFDRDGDDDKTCQHDHQPTLYRPASAGS